MAMPCDCLLGRYSGMRLDFVAAARVASTLPLDQSWLPFSSSNPCAHQHCHHCTSFGAPHECVVQAGLLESTLRAVWNLPVTCRSRSRCSSPLAGSRLVSATQASGACPGVTPSGVGWPPTGPPSQLGAMQASNPSASNLWGTAAFLPANLRNAVPLSTKGCSTTYRSPWKSFSRVTIGASLKP